MELPAVSGGLTGNEQIPLVQLGATKRASVNDILYTVSGGYIPNTRTVTASTGLSGGGALINDISIGIANTGVTAATYGSATTVPVVAINAQGQVTGASSVTIDVSSAGGVPNTRMINTVSGLAGGGALSADLTLSIAEVVTAAGPIGSITTVPVVTINARGQVTALSSATIDISGIGGVPSSRTISTSSGLTGGGDLTANRTLTMADIVTAAGPIGSTTTVPVITINSRGQVTTISSATILVSTSGKLGDPGANGMLVRVAQDSTSSRTMTGSSYILVTNGNGVAGNPTFAISGVLGGEVGGTSNAFFAVTGPASTTKTFTFPNASDTVAVLGQVQNFTATQRGTPVVITASGTIFTPIFTSGNNFILTVSGAMTLANPTTVVAGQAGQIFVLHNQGTGQTLAYGTNWKFPAATAPTITGTSGAQDLLCYYSTSTGVINANLLKGFA